MYGFFSLHSLRGLNIAGHIAFYSGRERSTQMLLKC